MARFKARWPGVVCLCCVIVVLTFFLSPGVSVPAVDKGDLAKNVNLMKTRYKISGMYSLAVSIPGEDPNNLRKVIDENPQKNVLAAISNKGLYEGERLAVATLNKPELDHAEYRLLKDLKLVNNSGDLLLIYSYASSCPTTCTNTNNPYNIIKIIQNIKNKGNWSKYAFVFEKVFKPKGNIHLEKGYLIKALEDLGTSGIGLENIFRCYKPVSTRDFRCTSCSKGGKVEKLCIDYNA